MEGSRTWLLLHIETMTLRYLASRSQDILNFGVVETNLDMLRFQVHPERGIKPERCVECRKTGGDLPRRQDFMGTSVGYFLERTFAF